MFHIITTAYLLEDLRWRMDFGEILSMKYRYAFTDAIVYISVRSIEFEYNRIYQVNNRRPPGAIFTSFMARESVTGYPTAGLVYNFVMLNPKKTLMSSGERLDRMSNLVSINIDKKLAYLVHEDPTTGNTYIHPMFAIMFAISISPQFAVEVVGHISGLRLAGCDANTMIGHLWEELDERELSIAEYKQSATLCAVLVDELRGEISKLKRETAHLRAENERLQTRIMDIRSEQKSAISRWCASILYLCRRRKVSPGVFERI